MSEFTVTLPSIQGGTATRAGSSAPSSSIGAVTTTAGTAGQLNINSGTALIGGNNSGGIQWGSGALVANDWSLSRASISYPPTPPPREEQKFDNLSKAQAISILTMLVDDKGSFKILSGLVGCFEMPRRDDVIAALNWLKTDRGNFPNPNIISSLNGIQSIVNLLDAVVKNLNELVKEGRALAVEEITK